LTRANFEPGVRANFEPGVRANFEPGVRSHGGREPVRARTSPGNRRAPRYPRAHGRSPMSACARTEPDICVRTVGARYLRAHGRSSGDCPCAESFAVQRTCFSFARGAVERRG